MQLIIAIVQTAKLIIQLQCPELLLSFNGRECGDWALLLAWCHRLELQVLSSLALAVSPTTPVYHQAGRIDAMSAILCL